MLKEDWLETFLNLGALFLYSEDPEDIAILSGDIVVCDRVIEISTLGTEFTCNSQ